MSHTLNVLRLKTAKAIMARCYEADKSSAIAVDGLAVHGNTIDAKAVKVKNGYDITITSTVLSPVTLKEIVEEVFVALNAHKVN